MQAEDKSLEAKLSYADLTADPMTEETFDRIVWILKNKLYIVFTDVPNIDDLKNKFLPMVNAIKTLMSKSMALDKEPLDHNHLVCIRDTCQEVSAISELAHYAMIRLKLDTRMLLPSDILLIISPAI